MFICRVILSSKSEKKKRVISDRSTVVQTAVALLRPTVIDPPIRPVPRVTRVMRCQERRPTVQSLTVTFRRTFVLWYGICHLLRISPQLLHLLMLPSSMPTRFQALFSLAAEWNLMGTVAD